MTTTQTQKITMVRITPDTEAPRYGEVALRELRKHFLATTSTPFFTTSTTLTDGIITVSMGSSLTSTLKPGRYVYDLVIENAGTKTRAVEGTVLVRGGVTR